MKIAVTGGAGYIGSHFVRLLLQHQHEVIVIDNLSRGHREAVPDDVTFIEGCLLDKDWICEIMAEQMPDAIVHFAAYAYVGESVEKPELYYENNVIGSLNLITAAKNAGISKFVFSSTCSLYGNPVSIPISENESLKPINPYAQTKLTVEKILQDFDSAYGLKYVSLRYFNAAGADMSGEIGESHDPETHLIPLVLETALGIRNKIYIYGDDYDTPDGTCIRDYIHVTDLSIAHLNALEYLAEGQTSEIFNLGTGDGNSVKEIIEKARVITGCEIISEITERRSGDPAVLVAENKKAARLIGWKPKFGIEEIIKSAWTWHQASKY